MTAESRPQLILASASPRRKQLLEAAGYAFEVIPPQVDEDSGLCSNCGPAEMVAELAEKKAADVVRRIALERRNPDTVCVIGCDTVVECGGQILGKPTDRADARRMLLLLAGREHRVWSGLCVWPGSSPAPRNAVDCTTLRMDCLTAEQLDAYLQSEQWFGKAGAFGYQDGLEWIHILAGSESNVVGLPMELLEKVLDECGTHRQSKWRV